MPEREIKEKIKLIKNKCISIDLTDNISEEASEISYKNSLPAMDSLIYTTAIKNNCILITLDNDFKKLGKVIVIEK